MWVGLVSTHSIQCVSEPLGEWLRRTSWRLTLLTIDEPMAPHTFAPRWGVLLESLGLSSLWGGGLPVAAADGYSVSNHSQVYNPHSNLLNQSLNNLLTQSLVIFSLTLHTHLSVMHSFNQPSTQSPTQSLKQPLIHSLDLTHSTTYPVNHSLLKSLYSCPSWCC